jgi:hypothetical protein
MLKRIISNLAGRRPSFFLYQCIKDRVELNSQIGEMWETEVMDISISRFTNPSVEVMDISIYRFTNPSVEVMDISIYRTTAPSVEVMDISIYRTTSPSLFPCFLSEQVDFQPSTHLIQETKQPL